MKNSLQHVQKGRLAHFLFSSFPDCCKQEREFKTFGLIKGLQSRKKFIVFKIKNQSNFDTKMMTS